MATLSFKLSSEIVSSYKRLSYKVWYALAEFVDNSTQAYENNKELLSKQFEEDDEVLSVYIDYERGNSLDKDSITITDNSIGMSKDDLEMAFFLGNPPANNKGRSRYGLGMKTAAFWLGDEWTITTKKLNSTKEYTVDLDIDTIAKGNLNLTVKSSKADIEEHYTIIEIRKLHRRFVGMTISKIKTFLASIYRFDIKSEELKLFWQDTPLLWSEYSDDDFIKNKKDELCKRDFNFVISGKPVSGWAGVLESGSRNKGGFALVQAKRIIQAPPDGYKPESIFGQQEGGRNDLINQRLVGEIFLDNFIVSHTKDTILWEGLEEEEIDKAILNEIGDLKKVALEFRKTTIDDRSPNELDFKIAFNELMKELTSPELTDLIETKEIPPDEIIQESNKQLKEMITDKIEPTEIKINNLQVQLYIDEEMSNNDPYVINDPMSNSSEIIIIVNKNHPFWGELDGPIGIKNYLRQCVYDGVAEWKAWFKSGSIHPDTIKYIKDGLLRLPFEIEKSSVLQK